VLLAFIAPSAVRHEARAQQDRTPTSSTKPPPTAVNARTCTATRVQEGSAAFAEKATATVLRRGIPSGIENALCRAQEVGTPFPHFYGVIMRILQLHPAPHLPLTSPDAAENSASRPVVWSLLCVSFWSLLLRVKHL
jgi:hypothetical protein